MTKSEARNIINAISRGDRSREGELLRAYCGWFGEAVGEFVTLWGDDACARIPTTGRGHVEIIMRNRRQDYRTRLEIANIQASLS